MAKTLVIKLAETINNDELRKLGEMRFKIKPISTVNPSWTPNQYSQRIVIDSREEVTLAITGDGYFTDKTLTQNLGKTLTVPTGYNSVYVSDGDYTLSMFNKYAITRMLLTYANAVIEETHKHWHVNLADFNGMDALTYLDCHWLSAYGSLASMGKLYSLTSLKMVSENGQVTGDLADIAGLTSLTYLHFFNTANITGDISSLAGMTELTMADLRNCYKLTGNTSSIAHLHPNNGGKLSSFHYTGTGITGEWPPSA